MKISNFISLTFCLLVAISMSFETVSALQHKQVSYLSPTDKAAKIALLKSKLASFDNSIVLFLNYMKKIKSISKYKVDQKSQAFSKFMEIHDELLDLFINADSNVEIKSIKILLIYLEKSIKKSPLFRKKPAPSGILSFFG